MATFTNYALLSYSGGRTTSNTVTGELVETLSAAKNAVSGSYQSGDRVTYALSLVNSGTSAITGVTVSDDLGGYAVGTNTVYPLSYVDGTIRYYAGGVLQTAPTVTAGPPLVISGITVPAGGDAVLIYEAETTAYAPLAADGTITNTATLSGTGLSSTITAAATISATAQAQLSISKALSPAVVTENGSITYTFVIENTGNTAAEAADNVVLSDTFSPILNPISVTYNGTAWTQGTNYTYDTTTGVFATTAGQITVPAATYTQNTDGTYTITPGTATLVVTGTV